MKLRFVRFRDSVRLTGPGQGEVSSIRTDGASPSADDIEVKGNWLIITTAKGVTLTAVANVRDAEPVPAEA